MSSKALDIANNVVTSLRAMTGIPSSSNLDVQPVELGAITFEQIPEDQFPHFNVIFKGEEREKEPSYLKATLSLEIVVKFRGSTESEMATWLAAVESKLAESVQRGMNYVHDSWVESIQWDSGELDLDRVVTIDFQVVYSFPFGSP